VKSQHTRVRRLAGAALLALAFGGSTAVAVAQQRQPASATNHVLEASWFGDTSGPLVYLSDGLTSIVQVFSASTQREVGLIYGMVPAGLAVDASGNIYVADSGALSGGQRVVEFAPQLRKPLRILDDTGLQPVGIGVGADGTVYAANDCIFIPSFGGCQGGPGNVVGYAPGATQPSFTLSVPGMGAPQRVAVDAGGNIVVSGYSGVICSSCNPGKEVMGEFLSAHTKYKQLGISHPLSPGHFDAQGRFALLRLPANMLDLYDLPSTKVVGSVSLGAPEPDQVRDFAFSSDGNDVWAAKMVYNPGIGHEESMEFTYTAGQQATAFLVVGTFGYWIAVSPGLQP
jgi:hypothetical protein